MSVAIFWWCLAGLLTGIIGSALWLRLKPKRLSASPDEMQRMVRSWAEDAMSASLTKLAPTIAELTQGQVNRENEHSRAKVDLLLKPMQETLESYRRELSDLERQRNKDHGSLGRLLQSVLESHETLKRETAQLSQALRRPTVRGRWGEIQLRRVVELAGLSSHCDFTEQASVDTEDGRLRPDLVVNLPGGRKIVVDSKAVLVGYLEAEEAIEEGVRKAAMIRHSQALRTRIVELSRKAYWEQFQPAPEFVVLFVPGEAFFSAALENAPGLIEEGFDRKVVLATPTTLMALLRAVAYGWKNEQLAENARRIAETGTKVHQALGIWCGHLEQLGTSLERSVKAYNQSIGSLEKTVMPPVRRLQELGAGGREEWEVPAPIDERPRAHPTTEVPPQPYSALGGRADESPSSIAKASASLEKTAE